MNLVQNFVFVNYIKGFKSLIILSYMFFWKRSLKSNWFKVFVPLEIYTISTISIWNMITNMAIFKASNNSQWPWDWFITQAMTIGFKHDVTTSTISNIWVFKTCFVMWQNFPFHNKWWLLAWIPWSFKTWWLWMQI